MQKQKQNTCVWRG